MPLRGMKRPFTELDCSSCFIAFLSLTQAIPIQEISGPFFTTTPSANKTKEENVCVHESRIYREGQNLSTSNPCETCVCDPPGFSCSLITCDLKPGCKAIHKANRCCPEYVCECERNGKVYGNGEKVEEPNPCKVCYCKGGEIKCALVTCYTRDDCEPGYVAGVCCPKYDHCPPLDTVKSKSTTPAPVIISDLKTESLATSVTYRKADDRDVAPVTLTPETESQSTVATTTAEDEGSASISTEMFDAGVVNATESEMSEIVGGDGSEADVFSVYHWEGNATTTSKDDIGVAEASTMTELSMTTVTDTTSVEPTTDYTLNTSESLTTDLMTTDAANMTEAIDTTTEEYVTSLFNSSIAMDEPTSDASSTTEESLTTPTDVVTTDIITTVSLNESQTTDVTTTTTMEEVTSTAMPLDDGGDVLRLEYQNETTSSPEPVNLNPVTDEDRSPDGVVKVIVPKTVKKDVDQTQRSADGPAPIVVMISADQIQFLKLAEEPPVYVESGDSADGKGEKGHMGVVVVPKTTPTTVEMVKVMDEPPSSERSATTTTTTVATIVTYEAIVGAEPAANASAVYTNSTDSILQR